MMDWAAVLRRANTVAEVIEVMDEFLSSRTDVYWQGIPESLRRPVVSSALDLERWHHALVKVLSETASPGKPLQELARVSLHGVARVQQIRLKIVGDSNDDGFSASGWRCA